LFKKSLLLAPEHAKCLHFLALYIPAATTAGVDINEEIKSLSSYVCAGPICIASQEIYNF